MTGNRAAMPKTVRYSLLLTFLLFGVIAVIPPPSRHLESLSDDTLPRLRRPENSLRLREGIPLREWTDDWLPLTRLEADPRDGTPPWEPLLDSIPKDPAAARVLRLVRMVRSPATTGSDREVRRLLSDGRKAEPGNLFYPAMEASYLGDRGETTPALAALARAASLERYDAREMTLFEAFRDRAVKNGTPPARAAIVAWTALMALNMPEAAFSGLDRLAARFGPAERLLVVRVASRIRAQSRSANGALFASRLVLKTAALPPGLASPRVVSRHADALFVETEVQTAGLWRQRLEEAPGLRHIRRLHLRLGFDWFRLVGRFSGALMTFILGIIAAMIVLPFARRLPAPPGTLLACLLLAVAFFAIDPATRVSPPADIARMESFRLTTGMLFGWVWSGPISVATAALIAAFLPFKGVTPPPSLLVRFLALLRDATFVATVVMLASFAVQSIAIDRGEQSVAREVSRALRAGEASILLQPSCCR